MELVEGFDVIALLLKLLLELLLLELKIVLPENCLRDRRGRFHGFVSWDIVQHFNFWDEEIAHCANPNTQPYCWVGLGVGVWKGVQD